MLDQGHARHTQHLRQLVRGYLERSRPWSIAGRRLRIRGGASRVKRNIAFDLLDNLMDVSVQYGDGAEAAQVVEEYVSIAGSPTPGLVDGPQRHMGEDDDGRAG